MALRGIFVCSFALLCWSGCSEPSSPGGQSSSRSGSGGVLGITPAVGGASGGNLEGGGASAGGGSAASSPAGHGQVQGGSDSVIAGTAGSMAASTAGGSAGAAADPPGQGPFRLLVFTRTIGAPHESIAAGVELISALGATHDFSVTSSDDPTQFSVATLAQYAAVVFLNTKGDVLDVAQQAAFEAFIRDGKGYVGVHSASFTEADWPWYGELVGAYFTDHPAIQPVTIRVENRAHPSTAGLPAEWTRTEEPYNFARNPRADVTVLATLDESSYSGGSMGADHPISWYREFDGGRTWYTALGHTSEGYSEELFGTFLLGGIEYAAGRKR